MAKVIFELSPKVKEVSKEILLSVGVSINDKDRVSLVQAQDGPLQLHVDEKEVPFVLNNYPEFFELVQPTELVVFARLGFGYGKHVLKSKVVVEASENEKAAADRAEVLRSTMEVEQLQALLQTAVEKGLLEKVDLRWSKETLIEKIIEVGV